MSIKNVYRLGPGRPQSIVVLAHGYGANVQDLLGLAEEWAPSMPDTLFLSPDAPVVCDVSPFGYQWFSLGDWSPHAMESNIKTISDVYSNFLDQIISDSGVPDARLALAGFSQGTMLSLYVAARRKAACAGVLGYSGALLGAAGLSDRSAAARFPVRLVHGDADMVVPVSACHAAQDALEKAGFHVEASIRPWLGHGIDGEGLAMGGEFLRKVLYGK